ncbi:MAG TPA: zinc ribbon domain-containing protein [Vicinamibacteria bacterium]|nr:zinc ribbon domain-containing protein [Vicinamibacteria bacterium]
MPQCPACGRPVAMARPHCVYCGARLPDEAVGAATPGDPAAAPAIPSAAPPPKRLLLVLDLATGAAADLASALGLSAFEAGQRLRRGGLQLHRVLEERAAEEEAAVLRASGLSVLLVPEEEARTPPLPALGGRLEAATLRLRTVDREIAVRREELLLVVRGPIAREYQPALRLRRPGMATLEGGYRIHLHRLAEPRPVELDPGNFELGHALTGSSLLDLNAWVDAVARGVPVDDAFRHQPPVLGPAEPASSGVMAATAGLSRPPRAGRFGREDAPALLDNVAQFRFYSGWRAAVERRRTG